MAMRNEARAFAAIVLLAAVSGAAEWQTHRQSASGRSALWQDRSSRRGHGALAGWPLVCLDERDRRLGALYIKELATGRERLLVGGPPAQ